MTNVLFLGRKEWSVYALHHLIKNGYTLVGIVGMRDYAHSPSHRLPIYEFAAKHGIPVFDNETVYEHIDETLQTFNGHHVDIIISYLYYAKIKNDLLKIAKNAAINFHPAPLPEYQGLGGYNLAILDGKTEYGVTAHIMVEHFDAGDIIKVSKFELTEDETAFTLERKSMEKMLILFKKIFSVQFDNYLENAYTNETDSGVYINKETFEQMKFITDEETDKMIERKIRAFWYPPFEGAKVQVGTNVYTIIDNKILNSIAKEMKSRG